MKSNISISKILNNKNIGVKLFISFLTLYSILFFVAIYIGKMPNLCVSDECAYFDNAINIFKGGYQDPISERISPPGYSLIISPLLILGFGRLSVVYLNLIFGSITVLIVYLTSKIYLSKRTSIFVSILWGFYYIQYEQLFTALTEPLATLLIILNCYLICKNKFRKNIINLLSIGFFLGLLLLTKPVFVYVLIIIFPFTGLYLLLNKNSLSILLAFILAFSMTLPFQMYTFKKTGKLLFFSNISGESLYWMSSPFKGEMGDWNNEKFNANCQSVETSGQKCNSDLIAKNHGSFIKSLENLDLVEKNQAYTKKAIKNIFSNPLKYFRNIINNISRMFFNIPSTHFYQREITVIRLIPNSILFTFILFSSIVCLLNINKIPKEILFCVLFIFTYLGLSSIVSAYARMLTIVVPFLFIWSVFSLNSWRNKFTSNF